MGCGGESTYPVLTGKPLSDALPDLPAALGSMVMATLSDCGWEAASILEPSDVECLMADTGAPSALSAGVYGRASSAAGPFRTFASSTAFPKLARRVDGLLRGGGSPASNR